jgi:hypothetical protein
MLQVDRETGIASTDQVATQLLKNRGIDGSVFKLSVVSMQGMAGKAPFAVSRGVCLTRDTGSNPMITYNHIPKCWHSTYTDLGN